MLQGGDFTSESVSAQTAMMMIAGADHAIHLQTVGDRAFADSLLVSELLAVDRLATGAVVVCKCIA
jgi:hypothetical protein